MLREVLIIFVFVLFAHDVAASEIHRHHGDSSGYRAVAIGSHDGGNADAEASASGSAEVSVETQNNSSVNVNDEEARKERTLYRGAMAHAVPQGNDGAMFVTPWGGPAITRTSRINALGLYYDILSESECNGEDCGKKVAEAVSWMRDEVKPKTFLNLPRVTFLCPDWNILCW